MSRIKGGQTTKQMREQGNRALDAITARIAPQITPETPPPAVLPPAAATHWVFLVQNAPEGSLLEVDRPVLTHYCRILAKLDEVMETLDEEKPTSTSVKGANAHNPYFTTLYSLTSLASTLASKLRMQPSMRMQSQKEKESRGQSAPADGPKQQSARLHLLFRGGAALPKGEDDGDDD